MHALSLYHPREEEGRYLLEKKRPRGRKRADVTGEFLIEKGQEAETILVQKGRGSERMDLGLGCYWDPLEGRTYLWPL